MTILALGAHPDDIEFGCGASLLKFVRAGHSVFLYVATLGELGGDASIRKREQEAAAEFIGAQGIFWGEYEDCHLILSRDLIMNVEKVISEVSPKK